MKRPGKTLFTVLAVGGLALLLGAAAGTQSDPLITMSYLNDVTTPAILAQVEETLEDREQALVDKLEGVAEDYAREVEALLGASGGTGSGGTGEGAGAPGGAVFSAVTVKAGEQLLGSAGCELLLRTGSAQCVASASPGLVDSTQGDTLSSGGALQPNHLYLVTADGWGLKATTDATVLVRGGYTIS